MFWSKENIYSKKRLIIMLTVAVMLISAAAAYSIVSVPYIFTSGTTISSTQMNANFKTLGDRMGVYKYQSIASQYLSSTGYADLGTITITAPAAGYIVVRASAGYIYIPVGAASSYGYAYMCISGASLGCNVNQGYRAYTSGMTTGNTFYFSPNLEYYYYVAGPGAYTYYLTGYRDTVATNTGNPYLYAPKMTATYIPNVM